MKARTATKDYYTLCCELEQSHARLLAALKSLSNDGNGSFKDWEDGQGCDIQSKLERPIKLAEKLCAPSESANERRSRCCQETVEDAQRRAERRRKETVNNTKRYRKTEIVNASAPASGSVAVAGDVVMVGPYPDKLHECDECGALKPWILMHDSQETPLAEVCQKCHDGGH